MTSADLITPSVEVALDEIYNEFEGTIKPEVERRLISISNLRLSVPGEIHTCVDAGVVR